MDFAVILNEMHKVPFFKEFTEFERKTLILTAGCFKDFKKGDFIVHQGERDDGLYVLVYGAASVVKDDDVQNPLSQYQVGAVFGEVTFLALAAWTTSVYASEPCTVFRLDQAMFQQIGLEMREKVQAQVIQQLMKRLENLNATLVRVMKRVQQPQQAQQQG